MIGIFNIFKKKKEKEVEPDKLTLREYLEYLLELGQDAEAEKIRKEVPVTIALFEKNKGKDLKLSDIMKMTWEDVQFELDMIERELDLQYKANLEMLDKLEQQVKQHQGSPIGGGLGDDGWNKVTNIA